MDCKSCKENREVIGKHTHEADLDRMDRVNKRWFAAWLITFVLLVAGIIFFFWYESQFETFKYTVTQENDNGLNNYTGEGSIYNGDRALEFIETQETEESDADGDGDRPEA